MNNMELTWAIVTSPGAAFADLKEKPRFLFPLIVLCVTTAAVLFWYYSFVDFEWFRDRLVSMNPNAAKMTEQQREQAAKAMARMTPNIIMWSSIISVVIMIPAMRAIQAVYFLLAGNVVNVRFKFEQWFALSCWTTMPILIATASMAIYLLTAGSNQIGYEEASLLSLNELFLHKTMQDKGFTLWSSLTLLHPWMWWLTVLGVRLWSGRSWLFSSVFALAPIALIYGAWAAWSYR